MVRTTTNSGKKTAPIRAPVQPLYGSGKNCSCKEAIQKEKEKERIERTKEKVSSS